MTLALEQEQLEAIPAGMRSRKQWVCWKMVSVPGKKPTKVPYAPAGFKASHDNPNTWGTLEQVTAAAHAFDGIGFVFTAGDPYCGIDLDACFTGDGTLKAWAVEVVEAAQDAGCYIERTPSGIGLHIIGRATFGAGRKVTMPDGVVETYDRLRYFTVTGDQTVIGDADADMEPVVGILRRSFFATPSDSIEVVTGDSLPDYEADQYTAACLHHASGDFLSFWHDKIDVQRHGGDRSGHRMSLLNRVAMKLWTIIGRQPTAQEVRAVALRSPFIKHEMTAGRSKWPRLAKDECPKAIAYAATHRVEAAGAAFAGASASGSLAGEIASSASYDVSAADFAAAAEAPDYVIENILRRGYLYALTGMSNAGKTSIGLSLVEAVNLGAPFAGNETTQCNCLLLAGENATDVQFRLIAMAQEEGCSVADILPRLTIVPYSFAIERGLDFLRQLAEKKGGFGVVMVDSKTAYFGGDKEDDNAQAYAQARWFRELTLISGKPAVVVLCHPTKRPASQEDLMPRGGSAFLNEIDTNLTAWKETGADVVQLWHTKIRGFSFDPIQVHIKVVHLDNYTTKRGKKITSVVARPATPKETEAAIAAAISEEDKLLLVMFDNRAATQREWAALCGWTNAKGEANTGTLSRVMKRLSADKLISRPRKSGRWIVNKAGIAEVKRLRGSSAETTDSGDENEG